MRRELKATWGIIAMQYCIEIWATEVTSLLQFRMIRENIYAEMSLLMQNYI